MWLCVGWTGRHGGAGARGSADADADDARRGRRRSNFAAVVPLILAAKRVLSMLCVWWVCVSAWPRGKF